MNKRKKEGRNKINVIVATIKRFPLVYDCKHSQMSFKNEHNCCSLACVLQLTDFSGYTVLVI